MVEFIEYQTCLKCTVKKLHFRNHCFIVCFKCFHVKSTETSRSLNSSNLILFTYHFKPSAIFKSCLKQKWAPQGRWRSLEGVLKMKWGGLKRNVLQTPPINTFQTDRSDSNSSPRLWTPTSSWCHRNWQASPSQPNTWARKQVIAATFSRILPFHQLPSLVISSPFEFSF